jgi:hypothetical protein
MSEEEEKKEWREKFSRWWDELVTEQGMRPTKVNEIPEVVAYYNQATQKNLKKAVRKLAKLAGGDADELTDEEWAKIMGTYDDSPEFNKLYNKAEDMGLNADSLPYAKFLETDPRKTSVAQAIIELKQLIKDNKKKRIFKKPKKVEVEEEVEEPKKEEEIEEKPKKKKIFTKKKKGTATDTNAISKESLSKSKPKEDTPINSMEEVTIKKKRKFNIIPKEIAKARREATKDVDLSKQPAPPRKSAGQRVRAVRSDKGDDHTWSDGRENTKAYKDNEDVDWSEVRCNGDTCWKTETRKTDATTANQKAKGKKVYAYNKATGHYKGQLRRKKTKV